MAKIYKKVFIEWIDAQSGSEGWECLEEVKPLRNGKCESVGFLLQNTKHDHITLCSTINRDPSKERQTMVLARISIPKCSITKITEVS